MNICNRKEENNSKINWKLIAVCIMIVSAVYLYFNPEIISTLLAPTKEITQIAGEPNVKLPMKSFSNQKQMLEMYKNISKCTSILDEIM